MTPSTHISESDLAALCDWTPRRIKQLAAEGVIPAKTAKGYPLAESFRGIVKHLRDTKEAKLSINEEKAGLVKEQRLKLVRERLEDEGKALTVPQWQTLVIETVPPIRQAISVLFDTELPATLAGRGESDIRGLLSKEKKDLFRRLRDAEAKLEEPMAKAAA